MAKLSEPFATSTSLSLLGSVPGPLRLTPGMLFFWQTENGVLVSSKVYDSVILGKHVEKIDAGRVNKGTLEEPMHLVEYSDVSAGLGLLLHSAITEIAGSLKVRIPPGTLSYGKLEPDEGNIFISPPDKEIIASSEFVPLSVNEDVIRPAFLHRLLLLPEVRRKLALMKSGKCHQRADIDKLLKCTIPFPSIEKQDDYLAEINTLATELHDRIRQIPKHQQIVDEEFAELFSCSIPTAAPIEVVSMNSVSRNPLLRLGYRNLTMTRGFFGMLQEFGETVPLGRLAIAKGGKRLEKGTIYSREPTNYRYLRGSDIGNGRVKDEDLVWITKESFDGISKYAARENDVVISIAGVVGKVAVIRGMGNLGVTENVAILRPKDESNIEVDFLMYLLQSTFLQYQITKEMSELRQQKLALEKLRLLQIPLPPKREIQNQVIDRIRQRFDDSRKSIERAFEIKDTLDLELRKMLHVPAEEFIYEPNVEKDLLEKDLWE